MRLANAMIHHRRVRAGVFAVVLAAWATGGVAFGPRWRRRTFDALRGSRRTGW